MGQKDVGIVQDVLNLHQRDSRLDGIRERGECVGQNKNGERQAKKLSQRNQQHHKGV